MYDSHLLCVNAALTAPRSESGQEGGEGGRRMKTCMYCVNALLGVGTSTLF